MTRKATKNPETKKLWQLEFPFENQFRLALTALGLTGLLAGCNSPNLMVQQVNAQSPVSPTPSTTPFPTPNPTLTPTLAPPTATATNLSTTTPWPTPTAWATATPWPTPSSWNPAPLQLPMLEPMPVVPTTALAMVQGVGVVPVNYSPPDGVDVFGNGFLRWEYYGELAEDEWFDIKIKPFGSEDSAFVDWTKAKEYPLHAWAGWQPGLYTWQIGIVKGHKEGDTKHFIADTGRDSQKFIIKWQSAGSGGGNTNDGGGGGGSNSGGGGGSGGS